MSLQKVSLADYDTDAKQMRQVTTPKSVEACRKQGLLPADLQFQPYPQFKEKELKAMGKHVKDCDPLDEEIIQMRHNFFES